MNKLKKSVLVIMLGVSIIGSIFSGLYFVVNVIEIPKKINEVRMEDDKNKSNTDKGLQYDQEFSIASIHKRFSLISIDLSAITPFILLWFFYSILLNSSRSIRKNLRTEQLIEKIDILPMPRACGTSWIQLGFVGTLWGFLLIGWKLKGLSIAESTQTLDILLKAFGTALLSTFTAVIIVYIFAPIIQGIWRWIHDISFEIEDADIERQLECLSISMKDTSNTLGVLTKEMTILKNEISAVTPNRVNDLLENIIKSVDNIKVDPQINLIPINNTIGEVNKSLVKFSEVSGNISKNIEIHIKKIGTRMENMSKNIETHIKETGTCMENTSQSIDANIKKYIEGSINANTNNMQSMLNTVEGYFENFSVDIKSNTETFMKNAVLDIFTTFEKSMKDFINCKQVIKVEMPSNDEIELKLEKIIKLLGSRNTRMETKQPMPIKKRSWFRRSI